MFKNSRLILKSLSFLLLLIIPTKITYSQSIADKRVSLHINNELLTDVLTKISDKTGVFFSYNASYIPKNHRITATFKNERLSKVLTEVLKSVKLDFKIINGQIIIRPAPEKKIAPPKKPDTKPKESTKDTTKEKKPKETNSADSDNTSKSKINDNPSNQDVESISNEENNSKIDGVEDIEKDNTVVNDIDVSESTNQEIVVNNEISVENRTVDVNTDGTVGQSDVKITSYKPDTVFIKDTVYIIKDTMKNNPVKEEKIYKDTSKTKPIINKYLELGYNYLAGGENVSALNVSNATFLQKANINNIVKTYGFQSNIAFALEYNGITYSIGGEYMNIKQDIDNVLPDSTVEYILEDVTYWDKYVTSYYDLIEGNDTTRYYFYDSTLVNSVDTTVIIIEDTSHSYNRNTNSYTYFNIPIIIDFSLYSGKKFSCDLSGGVIITNLVGKKGEIVSVTDSVILPFSEIDFVKTNYSLLAGVRFEYKLSNKINLFVKGIYRNQANSMYDETFPISKRINLYTVGAGIRLRI